MKFHDSTVILVIILVLPIASSHPQGHQLELRIKSEVTAGGQLRKRNQPLAVVLRNNEHGQWEQAVGGSQQLQILRETSQQHLDDTEQ